MSAIDALLVRFVCRITGTATDYGCHQVDLIVAVFLAAVVALAVVVALYHITKRIVN